ncbi:MAG: hypothetical protein NC293_03515 [Roseburia sp.]|nr:hypothetical protein [Roseburia sp.]
MGYITTDEVREYLANPNYMEQLQRQSLEVRKQIAELDAQHGGIVAEIITTSQVGISYDDNEGASSGGKKRDLSDVLDVTKKMIEEHRKEYYWKYQTILRQIETCHRLSLVYDTLDAVTREVLNRLYKKNETWECIEYELQLSHRKVLNIRRKAIEDIRYRYNSRMTNLQLAKQCDRAVFTPSRKLPKVQKEMTNIEGQLSLADTLERKEKGTTK